MRYLLLLLVLSFSLLPCQAQVNFQAGQTVWLRIIGVPDEDETKISGVYKITDQGLLTLPLLNDPINVEKFPGNKLSAAIEDRYRKTKQLGLYHARIAIELPPKPMVKTVLMREGVLHPASLGVQQGMRLIDAIELCGGPALKGNLSKVRVFRSTESFTFDLREMKKMESPLLQAGDQVWVLQPGNYFPLIEEPVLKSGLSLSLSIRTSPGNDSNELTGTYTVSDKGTLTIPKLDQPMLVAGLKFGEFERKLEELLKHTNDYDAVSVRVPCGLSILKNAVTIGGEVKSPGDFFFSDGLTLRAALAKPGGVTEYADLEKVSIFRKRNELKFDLRPESKDNHELQEGDQIVVRGE